MTSSAFVDDDVSLMEMLAFPKPTQRRLAPQDNGSKRFKQMSSHHEKVKGTIWEAQEKEAKLTKCSDSQGLKIGKSYFYHEAARLTPSMVKGLLLGHGPLISGAKEGDYGDPVSIWG